MWCLLKYFKFILVQLLIYLMHQQGHFLYYLDGARCLTLTMLTKFYRSKAACSKIFLDRIMLTESLDLLE